MSRTDAHLPHRLLRPEDLSCRHETCRTWRSMVRWPHGFEHREMTPPARNSDRRALRRLAGQFAPSRSWRPATAAVINYAAIADVLVRRLSLGVLVCDRVWLNRPVGGFVVGVGVGDRLGLVHLARLVVLRRVDGVDLHRLVADVGDVVPAAGRNDDAPAVGYLLVEGQFVLAGSHLGSTAAAVEPNELVGVRVLL